MLLLCKANCCRAPNVAFAILAAFFLRGDDQARDFRGKTPADVIGEREEVSPGEEPNEQLHEVIRRTLAGGMDLAQDAVNAADEVCIFYMSTNCVYTTPSERMRYRKMRLLLSCGCA